MVKRSEPARSTRLSLPQYLALLNACFQVTCIEKMKCDLELYSFARVTPVARLRQAFLRHFMASSRLLTVFSLSFDTVSPSPLSLNLTINGSPFLASKSRIYSLYISTTLTLILCSVINELLSSSLLKISCTDVK